MVAGRSRMQTADDLNARLETTVRQLEMLTAEVARNDAKMHRTQQRELRLLHAEDLQSLLHELLEGLCDTPARILPIISRRPKRGGRVFPTCSGCWLTASSR